MNLPEEITKNAIVGTDKYSLKDYQHLQDIAHKIETQATDREEMFLLMSAIAFTYDDAGSDGIELTGTMPDRPDSRASRTKASRCSNSSSVSPGKPTMKVERSVRSGQIRRHS